MIFLLHNNANIMNFYVISNLYYICTKHITTKHMYKMAFMLFFHKTNNGILKMEK